MRLVIWESSLAMSFGSANLSSPPLQTAVGILMSSILYTGGAVCKTGSRAEWELLYQKLCLEKGFCASISLCLSLLHCLQSNHKDEGHPLIVHCPDPSPCLWNNTSYSCSFYKAWLRVVLQFDPSLCSSEVWARKEQCWYSSVMDCGDFSCVYSGWEVL